MNEEQIQVFTLPQSLANLASDCKTCSCPYNMLKLMLLLICIKIDSLKSID